MNQPAVPELIAAVIFALALVHTFITPIFARLAHKNPNHSGFWHLLAEVEVVFGFWAALLFIILIVVVGKQTTVTYFSTRNFTEPMFVFAIMVMAASRPILYLVQQSIAFLSSLNDRYRSIISYFLCITLVPISGSFITEPAAMTLAAIMLRDRFYRFRLSEKFKYATIGVLFVNVSIGGTLTNFAAPPILMVAAKWQWDSFFVFSNFGWKALVALLISASLITWYFRQELQSKEQTVDNFDLQEEKVIMPLKVIFVHLVFLAAVVYFAHYPAIFMGIFLLFLGYAEAYKKFQNRLILREGLLVAFFLAGLVVLGGLQQWWLQPSLTSVSPKALYFLATALTAITDNAALTYLASLVEGVSDDFKYYIVAGAVTGGGLTVIANAPNPAGYAILKPYFQNETISAKKLFIAATLPTLITILCFFYL